MKFALLLALVASPVFAAEKIDAVELFSNSSKKWEDLVKVGEVPYLLNPIFCVNPKNQAKLVLVFSLDFRNGGEGVVFDKVGNATEINFNDLGLELSDRGYFNGVNTSRVLYAGKKLFCVESAMQLESVPGAF